MKDRISTRSRAAPHLALIAVQLMFGSWPIFGKIALRGLPSTGLVAFRVVGASFVFIILQSIFGQLQIPARRDLLWLALYSLLGVVLNQFLFVKGLSLTTVINATLLGTTIPVFTLLVSILFGYDRLSLRKAAGILLAACGVIYLVDPLHADFSGQTALGNLLIVANSLSYGAYIALSKDLLKRYGALTFITWIFIFGSLATIPIGAVTLSAAPLQSAGLVVWLAVLHYSGPDRRRLLRERVGAGARLAEHSCGLHLPATVNRLCARASDSWRALELTDMDRFRSNLCRSCRRHQAPAQPRHRNCSRTPGSPQPLKFSSSQANNLVYGDQS
jgi:drug/metabolite transporter (DMT)-like permease